MNLNDEIILDYPGGPNIGKGPTRVLVVRGKKKQKSQYKRRKRDRNRKKGM